MPFGHLSPSSVGNPEKPKPVVSYMKEMVELVQKIAPNMTTEQLNQLQELGKCVIAANCHSIRLLREDYDERVMFHNIFEANSQKTIDWQDGIINELQAKVCHLKTENVVLRRDVEVSKMLDDLEKELAVKVIIDN